MDRLVALLNEYEKERWTNRVCYWVDIWIVMSEWITYRFGYFISKEFWFIQRLVDNDKIDRDKVLISFSMAEYDGLWNMYWHWVDDNQRLLMILAISDTPIEDLVSTLK